MAEDKKSNWFGNVAGRRRSVVSYVKSPLGFYVLALLIIETFLLGAGRLFGLSESVRIVALATGVALFVGVVVIVTVLVIKYPKALVFSEHSHLEWESMHVLGDNLHPWEGRYIQPKAGTEPPVAGQIEAQVQKAMEGAK